MSAPSSLHSPAREAAWARLWLHLLSPRADTKPTPPAPLPCPGGDRPDPSDDDREAA
jgi:hypothetical protein